MSKLLTGLVSAAILAFSVSALANSNASTGATTQPTIETACATEATAANCGSDKGAALSKCIHEYKRNNKNFTVSEACHNAMKHGRNN